MRARDSRHSSVGRIVERIERETLDNMIERVTEKAK